MAEAPTGSSEGGGPGVVSISPDAMDGMPYIGNPQTATAEAAAIQNLANALEKFDHVEPNAPSPSLRPALICDTEDIDADKQQRSPGALNLDSKHLLLSAPMSSC